MNDYFHDWTNRYTIQTLLESDNSFINILFPPWDNFYGMEQNVQVHP